MERIGSCTEQKMENCVTQATEFLGKNNKAELLKEEPRADLVERWDALLLKVQENKGGIDDLITELIKNGEIDFKEARFLLISFQTRNALSQKARIILPGCEPFDTDVVVGAEKEKAFDIGNLRAKTGFITLDKGLANTGSCISEITFVDGERGILQYRGYPIEELAEKSNFIETAMLLIWGELPVLQEREKFKKLLEDNAYLHTKVLNQFEGFPSGGDPMALLSAVVASMGEYESELYQEIDEQKFILLAAKLISQIRTIAAYTYLQVNGRKFNDPHPERRYCANFLGMMFDRPNKPFPLSDTMIEALEKVLILSADHEQNCSTHTVRTVGSSKSSLYASISAGINALHGPLHGGANAKVIEVLERIYSSGQTVPEFIEEFKTDKKGGKTRVIPGLGHRVYKTFDPRAQVLKKEAETILKQLGKEDPLLDIAKELEKIALQDDYFISRNLYPNVDFYSGIILKALGIPTNMFPVMFAIGRLPGWIAQWKEQHDQKSRITRPRQIYTGRTKRPFVPMDERGDKN